MKRLELINLRGHGDLQWIYVRTKNLFTVILKFEYSSPYLIQLLPWFKNFSLPLKKNKHCIDLLCFWGRRNRRLQLYWCEAVVVSQFELLEVKRWNHPRSCGLLLYLLNVTVVPFLEGIIWVRDTSGSSLNKFTWVFQISRTALDRNGKNRFKRYFQKKNIFRENIPTWLSHSFVFQSMVISI